MLSEKFLIALEEKQLQKMLERLICRLSFSECQRTSGHYSALVDIAASAMVSI
jgi:hypothetical protein